MLNFSRCDRTKPKNLEWITSFMKDHRFKDVRFKFYIEDDEFVNFPKFILLNFR